MVLRHENSNIMQRYIATLHVAGLDLKELETLLVQGQNTGLLDD